MMSPSAKSRHAVIVGGGPGGLMAAETLAEAGWQVDVHDRMPSLGRKFLMAGRGGLNLTHSEPLERLTARYGDAADRLAPVLDGFPPAALIAWAEGLGQETFVGTSGRVFPKTMKASPLLRAWLKRLDGLGVRFHLRSRWEGWDDQGALIFSDQQGIRTTVAADTTILALGGASWPRLGSDGSWVAPLSARGIAVTPLEPANCGFAVAWSAIFRDRFAGEPLKRLAIRFAGEMASGEAMVTAEGLEGGAIYGLSPAIRAALQQGPAVISLDLRPDFTAADIVDALARTRKGDTQTNMVRKAVGLQPAAIGLLREAFGRDLPQDPARLAEAIKAVPVTITAARPIDRAISTAGGVRLDMVDAGFGLTAVPGTYVVGEMLDWEAPTGGYLLQATFATAVAAARAAIAAADPDAEADTASG